VARIAWPAPFPLGVADADSSLAFCKALDDLVVLRLADGAELWRARGDARPLLVGRGLALALDASEVLAFSLEDADRGKLRWRVSLPTSPTEAEAAWIGDDAAVHWISRERYRGGAHPGSRAAGGAQTGQCSIDPATGSARPLASWPARDATAQWESSDDPAVLAACVVGGVRFRLSSSPGSAMNNLRLVAMRASDDGVIWVRQLGALPPRSPPRLRS
jgi:hypothetical protein